MIGIFFSLCIPYAINYNIYSGLYWLIFPQGAIIVNDVFAYIFGISFGKTPLIKLSPKKTWEGFLGGVLATYVFGFLVR